MFSSTVLADHSINTRVNLKFSTTIWANSRNKFSIQLTLSYQFRQMLDIARQLNAVVLT